MVDAFVAQQFRFFLGLDPFRNRCEADALGQPYQCTDEQQVVRVLGKISYERTIDLDHVDVEHAQVPERGKAGAEIIQRHTAAETAQGADKPR